MSELTCGACGRPLREGARFCTGCGAPAAPVLVVEAQPPTRRAPAGTRATGGRSRRPAGQTRAGRTRAGQARAGQAGAGTGDLTRAGAAPTPGAVRPADVTALGAAFDGVRTVGVGARLGAFALDTLAVAAVAGAVYGVTRNVLLAAIVVAELAVGLVVWEARTGRTVGNLALGIRAARAESPYAPGLSRGVSRALVLLAGHLAAGVGQWVVVGSVAGDRSPLRQGWHDKAGRAVVVDVRGSRSPAATALAAPGHGDVPAGYAWAGSSSVGGPAAAASSHGAVATLARPVESHAPGAPIVAVGPQAARAVTPPGPSRPRTYVLTLDTGEAMSVSGPGVIGRAPRPRDGDRCDHVVTIDDPERSLSRTHARFGIDARGFWVCDAGSGNGTVLVLPSGQSVVVAPERPTPVPTGATIRIGDRTVLVEQLGG